MVTATGLASSEVMSKSGSRHFLVTVTRLPVTRCQICRGTVAYRPGNLGEVLTGHCRRAHPEVPGLPSRSRPRRPSALSRRHRHGPAARDELAAELSRRTPPVTERDRSRSTGPGITAMRGGLRITDTAGAAPEPDFGYADVDGPAKAMLVSGLLVGPLYGNARLPGRRSRWPACCRVRRFGRSPSSPPHPGVTMAQKLPSPRLPLTATTPVRLPDPPAPLTFTGMVEPLYEPQHNPFPS
jgi:hypothetical protein